MFLVYSAFKSGIFTHIFFIIGLLSLVIFGIVKVSNNYDEKVFSWLEVINIISAHILGATTTYLFVQDFHINSVVAASLVGLIGYYLSSFLVKNGFLDLSPNIYCGTFVGMAAATVLNIPSVVGAGLISSLLFIFLANRFNGCGGKLGSIAFMSCVITVGIVGFL